MKIIYFKRQSNDFDDILCDANIKKYIDYKISWKNHILIGFIPDMPDEIQSYINIKFGDDIVDKTHMVPDRTPIPGVDYIPKRNIPKNKIIRPKK